MALDDALTAAIHDAVEKEGQPKTVASRLIAWLDALSASDEPIERQNEFYTSLLGTITREGDRDED